MHMRKLFKMNFNGFHFILLGRFYRQTHLLEAPISTSEIEIGGTTCESDISTRQKYIDNWSFESQKSQG